MAHKLFIKYDVSGGVWELYEQVDEQTIEWLGAFDTADEADNMRRKVKAIGPAMTADDF